MDTSQLTERGAQVYEHVGVLKEKSWHDNSLCSRLPTHPFSVVDFGETAMLIPLLQQLMTKTPNQN